MEISGLNHKSQSYILLINVKMPTIVLTFMSRINFDLGWVEHEISFITSGPGLLNCALYIKLNSPSISCIPLCIHKFLNFFGHHKFLLPKIQTKRQNLGLFCENAVKGIANSEDPDQTAPLPAVWSGSALFVQTYLSENLGSLRFIWQLPVSEEAPCILPIFEKISLWKISKFPYRSYTSPYLEVQISLPKLKKISFFV